MKTFSVLHATEDLINGTNPNSENSSISFASPSFIATMIITEKINSFAPGNCIFFLFSLFLIEGEEREK